MFPYEQIKQDRDRSWSLKLLNALSRTEADDERDEIAEALGRLDDPRTHAPLIAMMENRDLSYDLRWAASDALNDCEPGDTERTRRAWWHSGDDILMRHAIRRAQRTERDLVELVASDPEHQFHREAIEQIACEFTETRFQRYKIQALSHEDKDVRESAASALLWDEPIAATEPLIYAVMNDNEYVADEAMDVLSYLCSQRVLLWLEEMAFICHPDRWFYQEHLDEMIEQFQNHRKYFDDPTSRLLFDEWLRPVQHLVCEEIDPEVDEAVHPSHERRNESAKERLTFAEVIERFGNPDGCWETLETEFRRVDWYQFRAQERQRLIEFFFSSPDRSLRWVSVTPLEQWGESDALMELLDDPARWVRKSAAYALESVPRDKRIARKMWDMLSSGNVGGTNATEILGTYVKHAPRKAVHDTLVELALHDERQEICQSAVWKLTARGARKHIEALAPLLYREPMVTWGLHDAVLDAHCRLGITLPNVQHLRSVDNMFLQQTLCRAIGSGC